jgi:hypothetical protein
MKKERIISKIQSGVMLEETESICLTRNHTNYWFSDGSMMVNHKLVQELIKEGVLLRGVRKFCNAAYRTELFLKNSAGVQRQLFPKRPVQFSLFA